MTESELDDDLGSNCCPYCGSNCGCAHLLLLVDLTFREVGNGLLYSAFGDRLSDRLKQNQKGKRWSFEAAFDDLVEEVVNLSDADQEYEFDGLPGMSCTCRVLFASTPEGAQQALAKFLGA